MVLLFLRGMLLYSILKFLSVHFYLSKDRYGITELILIKNGNMYLNAALGCAWHFATQWAVAHQSPLSIDFFRKGYWNEFPFSSPRGLPYPGTEPKSLVSIALAGGFFTTSTIKLGKKCSPQSCIYKKCISKQHTLPGPQVIYGNNKVPCLPSIIIYLTLGPCPGSLDFLGILAKCSHQLPWEDVLL